MNDVGVLIIGLGNISVGYDLHLDPTKYIYTHARAITQHKNFHLVAGVDPDEAQRQQFTKAYSCPAYPSIESAMQLHQPELVVIAVPTEFHGSVLRQVLDRASPKLVLCEKPLSYKLEEARSMVESCAAKDVQLYVNYMRRSDSGAVEIKRRVMSGALGNNIKGVAWYSKGFFHNGSHFLNLLQYWLGPVESSVILNTGRFWQKVDPEPDVQMTFAKGSVVFLAAWEEAFSHYTIELLSTNGRLRYEKGGEIIHWEEIQADHQLAEYKVLASSPEKIDCGMNRYQWHVTEELSNVLNGKEAELCCGEEALQTLDAMNQVLTH